VAILQYLETDYPAAVESRSEFELEEQRNFAEELLVEVKGLGEEGARFLPQVEQLKSTVFRASEPEWVSRTCRELVESMSAAGGLARAPRHAPSLERGKAVFATSCAACHGATGNGEVAIASTMNPAPASFLSAERMEGLSAFKAFNAITFGITGTAMPAFSTLDEATRWDLAFYLFSLRHPSCEGLPPEVGIQELANSTDSALGNKYGAGALACLRKKLPQADEKKLLEVARNHVALATQFAEKGQYAEARQALVDGYLIGFEPLEPRLRSEDSELVKKVEVAFARARLEAQRGSSRVAAEARELDKLLDKAANGQRAKQSFVSIFWLAWAILLREGFEAAIVIAALLAALKKMQQTEQARWVHSGWISALLVTGIIFGLFRHWLAGKNRELMEGTFALLAVGMLVYAALWLNARSNIRKFMGALREKMHGAMGRGSEAGLFAISFSAMFREGGETAIFLQGLSMDSPNGVLWGALFGTVTLLALVLFIRRVGYRLPMQALFQASTVILLGTAVILLGKGIHAFQETGHLPVSPFGELSIDVLGLYADWLSLVPQLVLALVPLAYGIYIKSRRSPNADAGLSDAPSP
jgi:high-affinity iron transporter